MLSSSAVFLKVSNRGPIKPRHLALALARVSMKLLSQVQKFEPPARLHTDKQISECPQHIIKHNEDVKRFSILLSKELSSLVLNELAGQKAEAASLADESGGHLE